jgi:dolichol-phosphate mannosyltransferase
MRKGEKLSVIVPVFNEERTINRVIKRLRELRIPGWRLEVIIVSDGSTDETNEILRKNRIFGYKYIFKEKNEGKGAAVRTGLTRATGEYVIIQDADLEYDPGEIKKLVKKVDNEWCLVVFGTRNKGIKNNYKYPILFWGAKAMYWLINVIYGQKLSDPENCYKLMRRDLLDFEITERGFGVEIEIMAKLARKGIKIAEVPIRYTPRGYEEGKKVTVWDGVRAVWLVVKFGL